jgi:hypothetical protein
MNSLFEEPDISVNVVTRGRAGRPGSNTWQGRKKDFFLFATGSREAQEPTQLPMKWVPGAIYLG